MKKNILSLSISAILSLGLTACVDDGVSGISGVDGVDGVNGVEGVDAINGVDGVNGTDGTSNNVVPGLKRLATAPLGAEFTGMFLNGDGTFFLNVQHPSTSNATADGNGKVYNKGTIGAIVGHDFSALGSVAALDLPITTADKEVVKTAVGSYQVLAQQDDVAGGIDLGKIVAADGTTVLASSDDPDFNGAVPDGLGGHYLYTNWEYRPGGMSRIQLSGLDANTGYASITKEGMLDFSSVDGTWVNCFGTVSPWGTMLSAEELYFDNTADWFDAANSRPQSLAAYLGYATDGTGSWPNPYRYGYNVEVGADIGAGYTTTAAALGNVAVNKQTTMGRFSHENAVVMPDQKTVFLSDDGTDTVFFKFVADVAGNMSAGTLYAAKVTQAADVKDPAAAAFAIEWIELAHGNETDIESWIAGYDTATVAAPDYITDQQVNDWAEAKLNQDLDGSGTVATSPFAVGDDRPAFLESRKAAAALGATDEFRKMEGVNINYGLASSWWNGGVANGAQAYMYLAMSSFDQGMSDDAGDIQLDGTNGKCGVVYRMKLEKNVAGEVDVSTMVPAIVGGPYYADNAVNECSVNSISNPDNLVILDDGRVLIGEDTGNHENNMIWLYEDPAI